MGALSIVAAVILIAQGSTERVGIFEGHDDVGVVRHAGAVTFNPATGAYEIKGSGENMWAAADAFQFAWKKASGDLALAADVSFLGQGTDPHRKACLMIRQDLSPDSAYVDIAVHGDGLTSLQFRDVKGGATHEVQANVAAPSTLRLVKRGPVVRMELGAEGERPVFSGAAHRVEFQEPFYVGLGVCAHNADVVETAVFRKVSIDALGPASKKAELYSTLETQSVDSTDRRVVFATRGRIEAPNWLSDGKTLIYNSGGRIYRVAATGGAPEAIDTGFANRCNNDHGITPDGRTLLISDQSQGDRRSRIYTLPVEGGTPTLVTPKAPSYWHGIAPDGKTLAYCAERAGNYDIYTIAIEGGEETRLTMADGLDDGPDYAPDGRTIYFNSVRGGSMQVWRMDPDGKNQEQVTRDSYNNWFPHPAPDGQSLVFLSYGEDVEGHPEDKDVMIRRMRLDSGKVDVLARLLGGQGTMNVPNWSPDSRRIAFVSYHYVDE